MKKSKKNKVFLKTFVISIVLMALPMGMTLFGFNAERLAPTFEGVTVKQDVPALNLVMAFTQSDEVNSFLLTQVDISQSKIKLSVLPAKLLLEEDGELTTLGDMWEERGGFSTSDIISQMLSIPIHRWANISEDSLIAMVDMVGAVDIVVRAAMIKDVEDGLFVEGRQLIDGRRLAFLSESGNTDFMILFLEELLLQHSEKISNQTMLKLFNETTNSGKNNLSISDFETRQNLKLRKGDDFITSIVIEGEMTEDGTAFVLHPDSLEDIKEEFQ